MFLIQVSYIKNGVYIKLTFFHVKVITVECHELGQKIRILGQGQEQDSSED